MRDLLVGIAQVDYTPRVGLPLMGNFRDDYAARGVHDPLYAKAIVLQDASGKRVALVSVDICMLDRDNVALMRERIAAQCPLRPGEILIAATHTHSAPAPMVLGSLPKCDDADIEAFLTKAAQAAVLALRDLRPAQLAVGYTQEHSVSFNRRLRCRDGRTHMNWEKLDPAFVIEPLGPIDPRLVTLSILRDGKPVAALVNFGLHSAILAGDNWLYSADYPGCLAESLARLHGPDFVTLFFNGPCGDVNHLDFRDPLQGRGYQMTQRVGYVVGVAAEQAMRSSVPLTSGSIRSSRETVSLPRLPISESDRLWCERVLDEVARTGSPGQVDGLPDEYYARTRLKMYTRQHEPDAVEVMVVRIGDVGIVGLPGEILCELGLDLVKRSPAAHTLVVGLANDAIGYIPTRAAYADGGYETTPGATMYQPGCGELLVDSGLRQLAALFED